MNAIVMNLNNANNASNGMPEVSMYMNESLVKINKV
jgi:hypothetical protein